VKKVYVVNKDGKSLMPTNPAKARILLKEGKAKVEKRKPFTIKLTYGSSGYVQPIIVGIDKGAKYTGVCAMSENEVLFSAQINHRTDVKDKMENRKNNRRQRRNRLWYREARFNNRSSSKKSGRIPPSIKTNVEEVVRVMNKIRLPISEIYVEDVQVDIRGLTEGNTPKDYQKSNRLDENLRMACLIRDDYTCQYCGKSNCKLEAHHIVFKSNGGSDTITNLISLCSDCHKKVHKGLINITYGFKKSFQLKMSQRSMQGKTYMYEKLKGLAPVNLIFGYETAKFRKRNNLEKDHDIDAFCIASLRSGYTINYNKDNFYNINFRPKQTRRQYFDLPRKGKGRIRYQVNQEIEGLRKGDIVLVKGKFEKQINSIYSNGNVAFKRTKGEPSAVKPNKCKLLEKSRTVVYT